MIRRILCWNVLRANPLAARKIVIRDVLLSKLVLHLCWEYKATQFFQTGRWYQLGTYIIFNLKEPNDNDASVFGEVEVVELGPA